MTETMRTTIRICDKYGVGDECPICGVAPGIYLNGKPFCLSCTSQYPHANVLGEGPNKSELPPNRWNVLSVAILAVAIEAAIAIACVIWRVL